MAGARKSEPAPPAQLEALARALAQATLPRILIVRGEERWFREQALDAAAAAAQSRGWEVVRHDTQDPDFQLRALCDDLGAAPMFAPSRCLIVRRATALLKKEGGEDTPLTRAAQAFVKTAALLGMLVMEAEGLRVDHALCKAAAGPDALLLTLRRLWDAPPPWERGGDLRRSELVQWLVAQARAAGQRLSPEQALAVCARTGNDLFALQTALERLRQGGGGTLSERVAFQAAAPPWEVAAQMLDGDLPRALVGLEALFALGMDGGPGGTRQADPRALQAVLFGLLRGKLRQALAGARALERGANLAQAASEAEVKGGPRAQQEFEQRLSRAGAREWERRLRQLAALERRSRQGAEAGHDDLVLLALAWRRRARA